jgi:hypothetical protein
MNDREEFKFNYEDMKDDETKERYRNDPIATSELLYNIGWALHAMNKRFDSGSVVLFSEVCFSKDMWGAVNYARLWPEANYAEVDSLLETSLGHLGDVHVKPHIAYTSITKTCREALALIKEAIILTDRYVDETLEGEAGV